MIILFLGACTTSENSDQLNVVATIGMISDVLQPPKALAQTQLASKWPTFFQATLPIFSARGNLIAE